MDNHSPVSSSSRHSSPRDAPKREQSMSCDSESPSRRSPSRVAASSRGSSPDSEDSTQALPSLRDFCSGRLPESASGLDDRIRQLGFRGQPHSLHPSSAARDSSYSEPSLARIKRDELLTHRSSSSSPRFSPYQQGYDIPRTLYREGTSDSGRSHSSRGGSPYPSYQDIDMDSDSDDEYPTPQQESYPRECFLRGQGQKQPRYYPSRCFDPAGAPSPYLPAVTSTSSAPLRPAFPQQTGHPDAHEHGTSYPPRRAEHGASRSWDQFVENSGRINGVGPVMFTCQWEKDDGDICKYMGKKQLAKRHVESVHLGLKPHVCEYCSKPFPQKTSLDIHVRSVHTQERSVKCPFCPAAFSDPARRHKHVQQEHPEHAPKKTRNKVEYAKVRDSLVKT